jgi:hypothetical protein
VCDSARKFYSQIPQISTVLTPPSSSYHNPQPHPQSTAPATIMLSTSTLLPLLLSLPLASAHFRLNIPTWRGDSFTAPASQWQYPCAGINATTDSSNRTSWPLDGGSVVFNGSHPWSMTYVNLALGSVGASFNITLVEGFNQTGPGVFCFKVRFSCCRKLFFWGVCEERFSCREG